MLIALSAGSVACGTDSKESQPDPTLTPGTRTATATAEAESIPTPPPGLTARFLDPAEVEPADVPESDYREYEQLVEDLIVDVESFWAGWFEQGGARGPWEEPEIVERVPGESVSCDGTDVGQVRGSFYCPAENYITYAESRQLLPLFLQVGPYAVAMVISHEFGHAVQRSLGIEYVGSEAQELQADCFAGVWFREHQRDGGFDDPEAPFLQSYAAMRTVSSGQDLLERFDALADGFRDGVDPCLELTAEEGAPGQ
jgi:Putative neutral zinc metallopeptidase